MLEAFFNQRVLPRGKGTVTTRPIIISLVTSTARHLQAPFFTFQDPRAAGVPGNTPIADEGWFVVLAAFTAKMGVQQHVKSSAVSA